MPWNQGVGPKLKSVRQFKKNNNNNKLGDWYFEVVITTEVN